MVAYDFKAARDAHQKLVHAYRSLKRQHEDDQTWSWWITSQIDELELEIADAHASVNAKMTTVTSSGHKVVHMENLITPIVLHWRGSHNEGVTPHAR